MANLSLLRQSDRARSGCHLYQLHVMPYPRTYRRITGEDALEGVVDLCTRFATLPVMKVREAGFTRVVPEMHPDIRAAFLDSDQRRQRKIDQAYNPPMHAPATPAIDSYMFTDTCPEFGLAPLNAVTFNRESQSPFETKPVPLLMMTTLEELARLQIHLLSPLRHIIQSAGDALRREGNARLSPVFDKSDELLAKMTHVAVDLVQQTVYMRRQATHQSAPKIQQRDALRQPVWGEKDLSQLIKEFV